MRDCLDVAHLPAHRRNPVFRCVRLAHSYGSAREIDRDNSGGLRRLPAALKEHQPSIVIIELGANDGLRGTAPSITEKNLSTLIKQAQAIKAKVLLVGMQLPPNYGVNYIQQFKEIYPKLAKKYRTGLVPFMLEGIESEEFQADNLHPVAEAQPEIPFAVF